VDGVPTAAIDGNLVVDDTILARHIQAGSIVAAHMAANQILVGHTIESANFETGVSGWQIDGVGGTAEFNNITMTLSYSSITGTKPPPDADKTSSNTAYDTARVNGASASTVRINAANGATFTSSSYVNNTQMTSVTSIMGGRVTTDTIGSTSGVYLDMTGSKLTVYGGGYGTGNGISLGGPECRVYGYGTAVGLAATKVGLNTSSAIIYFQGGNFDPSANGTVSLGQSLLKFNTLHVQAVYVNGTQVHDVLDDLQALHSIKSRPDGTMDLLTLPKQFTSYDRAKAELKKQSGDLITDKDLDDVLSDHDDMGHLVQLDLSNFVNLIEGAVRQLDRENSASQYEILEWLNSLEGRMKTIETRKKG
jgi:hypothetical protein